MEEENKDICTLNSIVSLESSGSDSTSYNKIASLKDISLLPSNPQHQKSKVFFNGSKHDIRKKSVAKSKEHLNSGMKFKRQKKQRKTAYIKD